MTNAEQQKKIVFITWEELLLGFSLHYDSKNDIGIELEYWETGRLKKSRSMIDSYVEIYRQ